MFLLKNLQLTKKRLIFAPDKNDCNMCTVNIKVDENLLRDLMPELDTTAAINLWVQQLVDLRIKELIDEDDEVIDLETAREMLHETIRKEYAQL
jgi:hypothetical protein